MTDIITCAVGSVVATVGALGIYDDAITFQEFDITDTAVHVGETWFGSSLVFCSYEDTNIVNAVPEAIMDMISLPYSILKEISGK